MYSIVPVYFRASSRIDYGRRRAYQLSNSEPVLGETPAADLAAIKQRCAQWAPRVARGDVTAEFAAIESAGWVAGSECENGPYVRSLYKLAFSILAAA